jgi:prolyl 4-hydroxylase
LSSPPPPPPSSTSSSPRLDRFGLPPPTEEDVFPPLSPDVVRVPVDRPSFDRGDVEVATARHLGVNLDAFDDAGRSVHEEGGDGNRWSLRMIHADPPIFRVDDFLSAGECEYLSSLVADDDDDDNGRVQRVASPTFSSSFSSSQTSVSRRTSTTWFCRYDAVPTLLAKARRLLGVADAVSRVEEPQVVMYRPGEEFSWHYDEVPGSRLGNGGQRVATLLVYLNDVGEGRGGGTAFRDLEGPLEEEEEEEEEEEAAEEEEEGTDDDRGDEDGSS